MFFPLDYTEMAFSDWRILKIKRNRQFEDENVYMVQMGRGHKNKYIFQISSLPGFQN
jgi:hypothetical protein